MITGVAGTMTVLAATSSAVVPSNFNLARSCPGGMVNGGGDGGDGGNGGNGGAGDGGEGKSVPPPIVWRGKWDNASRRRRAKVRLLVWMDHVQDAGAIGVTARPNRSRVKPAGAHTGSGKSRVE